MDLDYQTPPAPPSRKVRIARYLTLITWTFWGVSLIGVVIFNSLSKDNIFSIIDILMKGVMKRLANLGFNLLLTEDAKAFLADKGYDVQFGARPLHRAIQKYLEDPLAEEILNMNVKAGDFLEADLDKENNKLKFAFKKVESKSTKA
jgi:ATP-dependent Clp protease ATP-binding subunit ClpC